MDKLKRNGQVAVLVSSGFGAGWSTWGETESCLDGETGNNLAPQGAETPPKSSTVYL